jgi:transcriptional regulator with XRE-family HTH domain
MRDEFPALLNGFIQETGRSRISIANDVGVDPSYLTRIVHGDREPPRPHILEALCRVLRLSVIERNRLMVSAGYAPLSVVQLGAWSAALEAVTQVQNDIELSPKEQAEYEAIIVGISARFRSAEPVDRNPRVAV